MAEISALQARVAQQILRHALANSFPASGHITELWAQIFAERRERLSAERSNI
jgi:hypothetical protein